MEQNKLKLEEVARELGVSKTTVSRALSGKGRVSPETTARVRDYVSRSGRGAGSQPARQATSNLALVIPSHFVRLDLPFLRKCMGGICRMAAQRGYDVLLCYADERSTEQLQRQLAARKVDGVILSRTMVVDPCLELVRQHGVPYAAIGRLADERALQVDNDQVGAARALTRHLLQTGVRRIAYLSGRINYTVNVDRLLGFHQALKEYGVPPAPELVFSDVETPEKRLDALAAVLERRPECILCGDDSLAFDLLKDLRQRGVCVPGDIRLASLYDSEILLDTTPTVTAVQFDTEALGTAACRLLLDAMSGREVVPRQVQGFQVVLREST